MNSAVVSASRVRAIAIALTYAALSVLWILVSDKVAVWMFPEPSFFAQISFLKSWLVLVVTALLLYWLIRSSDKARGGLQHELQIRHKLAQLGQLLDSIVEGASGAIFAKDLEGRYLLCNTETARLAGLSLAQVLGQKESAVFPSHSGTNQSNDARVLREGVTLTFEKTVSTVDGMRTYLSTKGPLRNANGQIYGIFGLTHDITRRKRTEDSLVTPKLMHYGGG